MFFFLYTNLYTFCSLPNKTVIWQEVWWIVSINNSKHLILYDWDYPSVWLYLIRNPPGGILSFFSENHYNSLVEFMKPTTFKLYLFEKQIMTSAHEVNLNWTLTTISIIFFKKNSTINGKVFGRKKCYCTSNAKIARTTNLVNCR